MPVIISVEVDQAILLMQQTTMIMVVLQNTGSSPLENLNPGSYDNWPELLLTDLTTGDTQTFRVPPPPRAEQPPIGLPAGEKQQTKFDLNSTLVFPRPGPYELRAKAEWDGGEVVSEPVRLTVEPSTPIAAHVTTAYGSLTPLYFAAWLNGADTDADQVDLVLSDIRVRGDAAVRVRGESISVGAMKLAKVRNGIQPYLSIPPNKAPEAQWVAWLEERDDKQFIRYLLHRHGDVSDIEQAAIKAPGAKIIPPLLLHRESPKDKLPGAVALLHVPTAEKPGGKLHLVQIGPKGAKEKPLTVEMPESAPLWGSSAYRSNGDRRTFFVTRNDEGGVLLRVMSWSEKKPPEAVEELHAWDMSFVAAGLTTTQEDHIRGLMIGEASHGTGKKYNLLPWVYAANDEFVVADPIPILLPPEVEVIKAIPRINRNGAPYAALCVKNAPYSWCFCKFDGSVVPLPTDSADPRLLVDIVFRLGELPIVMYVVPGRGFQFTEPG